MIEILYKDLSYTIQGAFFEVFKKLGNGYKETVYHKALIEEFAQIKLLVENQKRIKVSYKGVNVGVYIPDLVIENKILIEIKAKPSLTISDKKQFWYYLKGAEYKVGYLVNFGSPKRVEYLRRIYDTARKF